MFSDIIEGIVQDVTVEMLYARFREHLYLFVDC